MLKAKDLHKSIVSASLLILMVSLWILFAPLQFGGTASYVILSGNSMSPRFILGDLVVVKETGVYKIGDAVAYEHPTIGYIFHRIIAINADGSFQFKGDHNDWVDSYMPTQNEIVGKLWLHIPRAGVTLQTLRSPWGFAILTLIFVFLLSLSIKPKEKKRNRGSMRSSSSQNTGETLFILVVLLLGALVLGIVAFRQPILNEVMQSLPYEEQAIFRYTANVPSGIYDSTQIQPGEPIFRQLNGSFSVNMDYLFISTYPSNVSGTYRLLARVSDGSGWKRTLELTPEESFDGNVFTTSGTLVLDDIQAFIDALERETGVQRGRYVLSIVSEIQVAGSLDGLPLSSSFSPEINFDISNLEVVLRQSANAGDVLNPVQNAALTRKEYVQNTLKIFGMGLPILLARWIALGIGLFSISLLTLLVGRLYFSDESNEMERLRIWYGSMLIEARDSRLLTQNNSVEIASLDDLALLAEQDQRKILHLPDGQRHHFFVQTPEQLYHYEMEEKIEEIFSSKAPTEIEPHSTLWQLPSLRKRNQVQSAYEYALKGWAHAVDRKLSISGQADRLAEMAYELAKTLGMRGEALENVRMAAYLHKIGLMDVPDEILDKKKKLTAKELEILRNHPTHARQYLDGAELLKPIAEAIYYQHERWDGSGQPEGLQGEEIPIGARIIAIVNIWDGLQQKRLYRDAWKKAEICKYFKEQAGKQFDPEIMKVFLKMMTTPPSDNCLEAGKKTIISVEEA